MSNITVGQIIMDAQRMVSRVKDLELLGNALLVEAEGNNRQVESLRQFQDDMDSLNRISHNKSNAEMVNRIQQQNANSSEILKENRELKVCIEDYERAMELIMQKYREHTSSKVLESKINFKEVYNDKLWMIIREQREKINEMAAVMQRAATADDDAVNRELELMSRLRLENKTLRELLQISKQFGSSCRPIRANEYLLEEKGVQTDADDSADELSLSGASIENANNNSVIYLNTNVAAAAAAVAAAAAATAATTAAATTVTVSSNTADITNNAAQSQAALLGSENNNGPPTTNVVAISFMPPIHAEHLEKTASSSEVSGAAAAAATTALASITPAAPASNAGCVDVAKAAAAAATSAT